jgi:hypothetical protein
LALPAEIDEFGDSLPRCATGSCVLSLRQEFLSLLLSLCFLLVDFAVVRFVETVNVFLGGRDSFFLLPLRGFISASEVCVAFLAPCTDWFGILFALGGSIVGVAGEGSG